ncbi:hypothetical protein [Luteipulveratus halotolerans]|uniref:hypothetical protein n=1 Tax=Luteipulveratus halotolerans TaxID=1631356 RepID=UPI0018D02568|nr:hypothetical protein [Luteipulveratus halotolerans]
MQYNNGSGPLVQAGMVGGLTGIGAGVSVLHDVLLGATLLFTGLVTIRLVRRGTRKATR